MIRQIDRSAATIADILAAARKLFAVAGFEATSIDGIAAKLDGAELRAAQHEKDAVRAYELVYAALGA